MARSPQQNGVAERKNKTIQDMSTEMLDEGVSHISKGEETDPIMYMSNRNQLKPNSNKTPYELWKGILASVKHLEMFGSKCFIKRNDKNTGMFETRVDKGIFIRYSTRSKGYSVTASGKRRLRIALT